MVGNFGYFFTYFDFSFLGVHCWIDAWSGKSLAQGLFYLLFVQQKSGFVQPVRKRRRDLLQSLLWQEFWTQRLWIWYWCRLSSNDLKRSPNLSSPNTNLLSISILLNAFVMLLPPTQSSIQNARSRIHNTTKLKNNINVHEIQWIKDIL